MCVSWCLHKSFLFLFFQFSLRRGTTWKIQTFTNSILLPICSEVNAEKNRNHNKYETLTATFTDFPILWFLVDLSFKFYICYVSAQEKFDGILANEIKTNEMTNDYANWTNVIRSSLMKISNVFHMHICDRSEKSCPWKQSCTHIVVNIFNVPSLTLKPDFLPIELKIFFITRTRNDSSYAISFGSLLGNKQYLQ